MKRFVLLGSAVLLAVTAVACGSDDDEGAATTAAATSAPAAQTSAPAATTDAGGATTTAGETPPTAAELNLPDEIHIGVPLDVSGPIAAVGQGYLDGIELAVKQINESGFLGSSTITIDKVDTASDKQQALEASLGMVDDDVTAIVGYNLTSSFSAAAPDLADSGIPVMTTGVVASDESVTGAGDNVFRVFPFAAPTFAKVDTAVVESIGAKKAAYLTTTDVESIAALGPLRKAAVEAAGAETVSEQAMASTDTDVRAQLTAIKDSGADIVFVSMTTNLQPIVYLQAEEIGLTAQIVGSSAVTPAVLEQAGGAMKCAIYPEIWVPYSTAGNNQDFVADYTSETGSPPSAFNALGYTGMWTVAEAIKVANSVEHDTVVEAMKDLGPQETPMGEIEFGDDRDANVPATPVTVGADGQPAVWEPGTTCTK